MDDQFENSMKLDPKTLKFAYRYAPILRFDSREPFLPSRVAVTLFSRSSHSFSFPRTVKIPDKAECVLEYAIWWDWDIQHLYELEHIWVAIDSRGKVVNVEGSWHGTYRRFQTFQERDGHPVVYSQPGKHAFSSDPKKFPLISTMLGCTLFAGNMGLLVNELFEKELSPLKTPEVDALIRSYLRYYAFFPSFRFTREFSFTPEMFTSWQELREYIPVRIRKIIRDLMSSDQKQ